MTSFYIYKDVCVRNPSITALNRTLKNRQGYPPPLYGASLSLTLLLTYVYQTAQSPYKKNSPNPIFVPMMPWSTPRILVLKHSTGVDPVLKRFHSYLFALAHKPPSFLTLCRSKSDPLDVLTSPFKQHSDYEINSAAIEYVHWLTDVWPPVMTNGDVNQFERRARWTASTV